MEGDKGKKHLQRDQCPDEKGNCPEMIDKANSQVREGTGAGRGHNPAGLEAPSPDHAMPCSADLGCRWTGLEGAPRAWPVGILGQPGWAGMDRNPNMWRSFKSRWGGQGEVTRALLYVTGL